MNTHVYINISHIRIQYIYIHICIDIELELGLFLGNHPKHNRVFAPVVEPRNFTDTLNRMEASLPDTGMFGLVFDAKRDIAEVKKRMAGLSL